MQILDKYIKVIGLPSKSNTNLYNGTTATVSGWGSTSDDASDISDSLRFVEVPVITNLECSESFGVVPDSNLCTASPDGKSSCTVKFDMVNV
jgi:Trypsin